MIAVVVSCVGWRASDNGGLVIVQLGRRYCRVVLLCSNLSCVQLCCSTVMLSCWGKCSG